MNEPTAVTRCNGRVLPSLSSLRRTTRRRSVESLRPALREVDRPFALTRQPPRTPRNGDGLRRLVCAAVPANCDGLPLALTRPSSRSLSAAEGLGWRTGSSHVRPGPKPSGWAVGVTMSGVVGCLDVTLNRRDTRRGSPEMTPFLRCDPRRQCRRVRALVS